MMHHTDITIGIYLFCIILLGDTWHLKIWESCEALIPYKHVMEDE
jgi:hypothetical protein